MKIEDVETGDIVSEIVNAASKQKSNFWKVEGLPSKFKIYKKGTKLLARPLKVLELKMLSTLNENNMNFVINDIISKATQGIDVNDLAIGDKLFLIFWLRANTYKNISYPIEYTCYHCGKSATHDFNHDDLKINYIKDDFNEDNEIKLPSGSKIKIHAMRTKDEILVQNFLKTNAKAFSNFDDDLLTVAALIDEINGEKLSLNQKYNWLIDLEDPRDYSYIISYINHYDFGVDTIINADCKHCGGDLNLQINFRPDFFISEYKFDRNP